MNLKPDVVPQPVVIEQVKGMLEQKNRIQTQIEQLERRLKLLQSSIAENGQMSERVSILQAESLALFEEEWKRKSEFFPDLWLASLETALLAAIPPKKK